MISADFIKAILGETAQVADITVVNEKSNNLGRLGIHQGDIISFGSEPQCCSQELPSADGKKPAIAYYVACTRNGEDSVVAVSNFYRRDREGNLVGKFRQQFESCKNFEDFYKKFLAGKTITTGESLAYEVYKFVGGQRTDTVVTRHAYELVLA